MRIDDLSDNDIGRNPGVDLDAVVLHKSDGSAHYAWEVVDYWVGPNAVQDDNPNAALGYPNAFPNFPDLATCDIYEGTASLGGAGTLTLRFDTPIEAGDTLEAYERGGCEYAPGLFSIAEAFSVSVGADGMRPDELLVLGEGEGPVTIFVVPTLPAWP